MGQGTEDQVSRTAAAPSLPQSRRCAISWPRSSTGTSYSSVVRFVRRLLIRLAVHNSFQRRGRALDVVDGPGVDLLLLFDRSLARQSKSIATATTTVARRADSSFAFALHTAAAASKARS